MAFVKTQYFVYVSFILLFYNAISLKSIQQLDNFNMNPEHKKYRRMQRSLQQERKCLPKLELLNCGASTRDMPRISPYKNAIILSSVDVNTSCENIERVSMKWEVWLLPSKDNYRDSAKILDFLGKQNYFVKQGSLYYGIYEVKLQSHVVLSNQILSVNASCYFEMVCMPVQTVIVGGYKRLHFFKNPVTFDILTFVVPDVDKLNQGIGKIPPLNIIYEWQCDSGESFCSPYQTTKAFRKIVGPFTQSKEYNFSLKTQTNEKNSASLSQQPEFQAIVMGGTPELELFLICLINCGGNVFKSNPQEIIHLEAKLYFGERSTNYTYNWNYTIKGSVEKVENISQIREQGTATDVFIVKRNKLMENKKYVFSVRLGDSAQHAEIVVETCFLPISPKCTIFPDKGIRGETHFNIDCSVPKQKEDFLTVTFEFYDRYTGEDLGRYLGLSTTGTIKRVLLTRDKLFVRTINLFGAYLETVINVQLSPFAKNMSYSNLKPGNYILGNYINRIGLVTTYGDYSNTQPFSPNVSNLLLRMLTVEERFIEEITGATLLINALYNIFCNTSNTMEYLDSTTTRKVAQIMYHVSQIVKDTMTNPLQSSRYTTSTRVLEISDFVIKCSSELLGSSSTHSYYNIMDSSAYSDLKVGGLYVIESLNNILTAVAFKVLISTEKVNLISKYIEVILWNIGPTLENVTHLSGTFQMSLSTTKDWLKALPKFYIQIINFNKMPFWWLSRPGGEINTNIIGLRMKHGADFILINETDEKIKFDLNVLVDFEPLMINGSVKQPNYKDSPDVNDFIIAVHRIAPVVNSKTFIKFVGIEANTTLRAILLQDQRPDFDFMNLNAVILSNKSSSLHLTMTESNDLFLYLGILPGKDVKIGKTINYTFELFTASCKVRRYESWMMGPKCKVTNQTNTKQVSCICSMFTVTLGGRMFVPTNDFNPFSDIPLLISASDYPFAIISIAVVTITYIFLLIWTNRKDDKDKKRVNLIVLEDNDIKDTCGYLVGVFTGSRIRAGTTSNVGIMLLGEDGMSRSHMLKSELRPTLQASCDDWFLLYTRHHLGSLTKIIIWMDYTGSNPHWYCSKIFVCDLQKYDTDTFYIEKWFGINIEEIHLKMVKECATYKEINKVNRIISENIEYGFRENHLWLSLFIRHPRSLVTSSQRLAVAFCSLFVTIGVATLIYFLSTPQMEDPANFRISKETFIYGIVSGLVGSLFSFITLHFFKTSYKLVPSPEDYHEHLDGATMYHLERQRSILVEDPSWLQKIKKIIHYIKPCRVMPVQSQEASLVGIKINRRKIIFATLLCIIISVLSIHLTVTCGVHFGEIKSLLWFTSLVIAMIQTVCVILPLKVLVTSLISVVLKTHFFPLRSHIVQINKTKEKGGKLKRMITEEFSEHLTRRKTLFFKSSHRHVRAFSGLDLQRKQAKIKFLWTSYFSFGCLFFLAIVFWLIVGFNLEELCIINNTVCRNIVSEKSCQFSHYSSFNDYDQVLGKIQQKILPVLYSRFWYNGASKTLKTESFPNSGWLGDGDSRLIGPPRLRQIRVKDIDNCRTPKLMVNNSSRCFVQLNAETEDTGKYSTGWVVDDWIDCQYDQSSWHFTDAKQAMGAEIRTPSGFICHGGGFIFSLRASENNAKLMIRNIMNTNWIDRNTRLLLLEFTTYNVNSQVFTSFTFFAESTAFGTVTSNQIVQSVKLSYLPIIGIIFLLYFVVFFLRVLVFLNITGIGNFFKNFWNIQDVLILVSYFVSVIFYSHMLIQKGKYREDIQKQGKDVYFQVQILTSEIANMKNTISVLFCLVAFRMLRIIRFNADVRQYLHDLYSAIQGIVWIWVVLSLFIFVQWRLVMFLVVPPPGDSFKDILVYQSDFKMVIYQYQDVHGKILAFLISLLTQIGMFSYVCSLTHFYRKGQLKRNPPQTDVDLKKQKCSRYSRLLESSCA